MSKCENCRLRKESARAFDIHWHGEDDCPYEVCPEIKTNADRIRQMSDKELAEFCFRITDDVASYYGGDGYEQKYPVAPKGWLDWLRQEAKDEEQ